MTIQNKASDFQSLILSLRQRGMEAVTTRWIRNDDGTVTHFVDLTYYGPGTPMKYHTIEGLTEIAALENAREFLMEHGLPL